MTVESSEKAQAVPLNPKAHGFQTFGCEKDEKNMDLKQRAPSGPLGWGQGEGL